MIQVAGYNEKIWAEAVNTAGCLKNRSSHKAIKGSTPEELWTGKKIDMSYLKVFGCLAYAHVPKDLRNKLDAKARPYLFVGYCENTKDYKLLDVEEK